MWALLCWILGHLPQVEATIEGVIKCVRCGKVLVKEIEGKQPGPASSVDDAEVKGNAG